MNNEKNNGIKKDCRWYEKFIIVALKNEYKHLCHLTPDSKTIQDCKDCEHYEKCNGDDK